MNIEKPIAVLCTSDRMFKSFLRHIPETSVRQIFRKVCRPEDAYGIEFSGLIDELDRYEMTDELRAAAQTVLERVR